jgi:hypothetical protein
MANYTRVYSNFSEIKIRLALASAFKCPALRRLAESPEGLDRPLES